MDYDSRLIASRKHVARPEKETEKEEETEAEIEKNKTPAPAGQVTDKPKKEKSPIIETAKFDLFWKAYPKRINKAGAIKKWNTTLTAGETDPDQLILCAEKYSMIVKGKEDKYILHPATFLGPDRRWKDYLDGGSTEGGRDEVDYDEAMKPKRKGIENAYDIQNDKL